ncbi:hypothetical protein V5799_005427, partial [Amblyomma americanum]
KCRDELRAIQEYAVEKPALNFDDDEGDSSAVSPDSPHDGGGDAVGRCSCGFCGLMPTPLEQVCCLDVPAVVAECEEGCVTQHRAFQSVCCTLEVLRLVYWAMRENGAHMEEDEELH